MVMKRKTQDLVRLIIFAAILVVMNIISHFEFFRIDLTQEKRYTLSSSTVSVLENIDEPVLFKVYLEGEFPAGFRRLRDETVQMLEEFQAYSDYIEFEFIDPSASEDEETRYSIYRQLQEKGIEPTNLQVQEGGGRTEKVIFPGALVYYKGRETTVMLLKSQIGASSQTQLNNSIQSLEFDLAHAIQRMSNVRKKEIAFIEGHGELDEKRTESIAVDLSETYNLNRFNLRNFELDESGNPDIAAQIRRMRTFDCIVIAKPTKSFTDLDKYLIDQYIMGGGKAIWLLDGVDIEMDSLSNKAQTIAGALDLNIKELLFKYGARVNHDLVKDMQAAAIPIVTRMVGNTPQYEFYPWPYFPLVVPGTIKHPITNNLNAVKTEFISSVDTISSAPVRKQFILQTSQFGEIDNSPAIVSLSSVNTPPVQSNFSDAYVKLGVLLEGEFESAFKNRIIPNSPTGEKLPMVEKSKPTAQIVIADGDIIKNQIQAGNPLPVGYDKYTQNMFGNRDFLLNCFDYLLDDSGLISVRSREVKMRLLNKTEIETHKSFWKILNTAVPIGIVIAFGFFMNRWRKFKYARKK